MKPYYENENGKLYHTDCFSLISRLKNVDLVLTDPPYGIGLEYDGYDDSDDNWFELVERLIPALTNVSKMVIMPCCRIVNLKWVYEKFPPDWIICWYKGSCGHRSYIGFNDWEPHLVYGKINESQMHDYFQTVSSPTAGTFGHPCPKPVNWAKWLVSRATGKNMTVYDPMVGSGTTAVACEMLGRKWIASEQSEKYCEIAANRIDKEYRRSKSRLSINKTKTKMIGFAKK